MEKKIIELLDQKISDLKDILSNNEFLVYTEYDYISKNNLKEKLDKIKELVENSDIEIIMIDKKIWEPLYNVLDYDVVANYKRQQKLNSIIRYVYIFVIILMIFFASYIYFLMDTDADTQVQDPSQEIVYTTWFTQDTVSNFYNLYLDEEISHDQMLSLLDNMANQDNMEYINEILSDLEAKREEQIAMEEEQEEDEAEEIDEETEEESQEDEEEQEEITESEQQAQEEIDQTWAFQVNTVTHINLRQWPGLDNPIISVIPDEVSIYIKDYEYVNQQAWYKTSYDWNEWWISWVGIDDPDLYDN